LSVTYTPKGSMCIACVKKTEDCSKLPFHSFPVIETTRDTPAINIVKCMAFKRDEGRWRSLKC